MEWYLSVLKQYAEFGGRARRKEYWMFTLINCLIIMGLTIVATVIRLVLDVPLASVRTPRMLMPLPMFSVVVGAFRVKALFLASCS